MAARTFRVPTSPVAARVMAALFCVMAIGFAVLTRVAPGAGWHRSWPDVVGCVTFAVLVLVMDHAMAGARLTVDDRGMRLENRSRAGWMGQYRPWSVEWKDVDHVVANPALGIVQLKHKGRMTPVKILVRQWIAEDAPASKAKGSLFKRRHATQSELWRELDARGLFEPERFGAGRNVSDFDMAKHPATRWSLIVGVVLLAYGIADLGVHPEANYLVPSLVIAAFAGVATFMVVRRMRRPHAVPIAVAAVVRLFMAGSTLIAAWAALSHWGPALFAS